MRHVWDWHMPWSKQARCWCAPFVARPELADVGLSPLVFHRPYPEAVFWEHGEQGPQITMAPYTALGGWGSDAR